MYTQYIHHLTKNVDVSPIKTCDFPSKTSG